MGRTVAIVWQASFSVIAAVLYFLFVLPRWWELTGTTSPTLGTALRITSGVVIALAALPVLFTLVRTRKPEFGTPQLALTLRSWSIAGHALAGVLIAGTAISEIWLSLDDVGQWLFGIYGAAAAVAVLSIAAFYLSFAAELPPPPPKPLKPKEPKRRRRDRKKGESDGEAEAAGEESEETEEEPAEGQETVTVETDAAETAETETQSESEPESEETVSAKDDAAEDAESEDAPAKPEEVPITVETLDVEEPKSKRGSEAKPDEAAPTGGLKNRRPSGKVNRRGSTSTRSKPK